MDKISLKCPAKINLSLDVVGKREDGYHLLRMIMQSIELFDVVTIERKNEGIELSCTSLDIPCDSSNTAFKAAKVMMDRYKISEGVKIEIDKKIPVAAGLAGGSTDAAGVIMGMNELFHLGLSEGEMMEAGLLVGADVPFCILQRTTLAEGIGEVFTPLGPIDNVWCVIAKPPVSVSTKEVYGCLKLDEIQRHPNTEKLMDYIDSGDIRNTAANMVNVLENVTAGKYPVIEEIKDIMMNFNSLGSMMSGSGPTVFGIFEDRGTAEICYNRLRDYLKEVHIVKTYNKGV